jgi:(1->4)-alpha-D-glucan 1-alpha-D-glucosylmutase
MLISLASEVNVLGYQLKRIAAKHRRHRDFTLHSLTFAVREVIAALPVYRTYVVDYRPAVDRQCRVYVETAIREAKRRNPRTAPSIFDFIGDILLQRYPPNIDEDDRLRRGWFLMKFQQTTGPVMAKGLEDTAFYLYNRLASLNEVGGSPDQFGISVAAFHRQNAARQRSWPHSLICTSTHDSKRSEDVRARIDVLSELPREWKAALGRWSVLNRPLKRIVDGRAAPDANEEYLFYQTLLGAWPLPPLGGDDYVSFVARMQTYMLKAIKEAKVNTSWINPNERYEQAVQSFVRDVLDDDGSHPFLADFAPLQSKVAHFGAYNGLSQVLLKIASPGVPDFYQGTELWDFSLVDPDNRRPVDFARRMSLLANLERDLSRASLNRAAYAAGLLDTKEDGRIKLYVTRHGLACRRANEELFRLGSYQPLAAYGSEREHVCAFARSHGGKVAIAVAPRLLVRLTGGALVKPLGSAIWQDSWLALPPGRALCYRNVFTDEVLKPVAREGCAGLPLAAIFARFPVALLEIAGGGRR